MENCVSRETWRESIDAVAGSLRGEWPRMVVERRGDNEFAYIWLSTPDGSMSMSLKPDDDGSNWVALYESGRATWDDIVTMSDVDASPGSFASRIGELFAAEMLWDACGGDE